MAESNLPAVAGTAGSVFELLTKNKSRLQNALPKHFRADRMISLVLNSVAINPKLLECSEKSLMRSIVQAGNLGLEIGPHLQHANLVPYGTECQLIIGYRGYAELAVRSGKVKNVYARIVYEKEPFKIEEGEVHQLTHHPLPPSKRGEKKVGAYAVAILIDGSKAWEWMWMEEIDEVRKQAMGKKKNVADSPWTKWPEEMEKKTPMRRLAKWLPLSPEWQKAAIIEEYQEAGVPIIDADIGFDLSDIPESSKGVEQKSKDKEAALTEKLAGPKHEEGASPNQAVTASNPPLTERQNAKAPPNTEQPPGNKSAEVVGPQPPPFDPGEAPPVLIPEGQDSVDLDIPLFEPPDIPGLSVSQPPLVVLPKPPAKVNEFRLPEGKTKKDYIKETGGNAGMVLYCPPGGWKKGMLITQKFCRGMCDHYEAKKCPMYLPDPTGTEAHT
jgi:recombination protein RecT